MSIQKERSISWKSFQREDVDPELLKLVKTASVVEGNSADYVHYLERVFCENDLDYQQIQAWGKEEQHHGLLLGRWAEMADPTWHYDQALERFRRLYSIPQDTQNSVRGSHGGEMIARCVVEIGTSSFYLALADASREHVLKQICHDIARDEFRHFGLFHSKLKQLSAHKNISLLQRLKIAAGRIMETSDDELAAAYYSANMDPSVSYQSQYCSASYLSKTLALYRKKHIQRVVRMLSHVIGLPKWHFLESFLCYVAQKIFSSRARYFSLLLQK